YDTDQMEQDKEYIAKKLGISVKEFDEIIAGPNKTPYDYKNSIWMLKAGVAVSKLLGMEARNFRF
ncbi:MAG: LPS biosynthesis protein, partial [Pseudobutyrivibrio sp.]|nr:LPS biosynthesis protein [Pseudobutyrivibrio sp.]